MPTSRVWTIGHSTRTADEFVSLLEPAVKGIKVLDPADKSSEMGPLISAEQRTTVQGFVDESGKSDVWIVGENIAMHRSEVQ